MWCCYPNSNSTSFIYRPMVQVHVESMPLKGNWLSSEEGRGTWLPGRWLTNCMSVCHSKEAWPWNSKLVERDQEVTCYSLLHSTHFLSHKYRCFTSASVALVMASSSLPPKIFLPFLGDKDEFLIHILDHVRNWGQRKHWYKTFAFLKLFSIKIPS